MLGRETETVEESAVNGLRPQFYRRIWRAYGAYVAPLGRGLKVDFGKFASSLGYETNYTYELFINRLRHSYKLRPMLIVSMIIRSCEEHGFSPGRNGGCSDGSTSGSRAAPEQPKWMRGTVNLARLRKHLLHSARIHRATGMGVIN